VDGCWVLGVGCWMLDDLMEVVMMQLMSIMSKLFFLLPEETMMLQFLLLFLDGAAKYVK
jgi:hypothetical protein